VAAARHLAPLVALAGTLAACSPGGLATGAGARGAGDRVAGIVSNNAAGVVGNNAAGIVGNNAAGFAGTVRGPAALGSDQAPRLDPGVGAFLSPGAAGQFDPGVGVFFDPGVGAFYRLATRAQTQALEQVFLGGALVYLSRPDETLYRRDGKVVGTTSDEAGRYDLGRNVLGEGLDVIVNAVFAGNRRLVGHGTSRAGSNTIDLDLGSTYALELLRSEARRDGRTFVDYDAARLPDLVARARAAIASGSLGADLDNLVVGRRRELAGDYAAALGHRRDDLARWATLLGRPLLPLVTLAGTFGYGLNAAGPAPAREAPTYGAVAVAVSSGSVFVADRYSHQIAEVDAAGLLRPQTAVSATDPTVAAPPPVPESGTVAAAALIPSPIALAADAEGNLFIAMNSGIGAPRNVILMRCATPGPKFGIPDPVPGRLYRIAGTLAARSDLAGFNGPAGLAADESGNLFVADRQNDRVLLVHRAGGTIERVAGRGRTTWTLSDSEVPAGEASLFMPAALAWRRAGGTEELFVADAFYQRIRVIRKSGSTWGGAAIATVAGSGGAAPGAGAPVVPGAFAGDGGPASRARLHLAQVDEAIWYGSELPLGGLAVDSRRDCLYFSDVHNRRIRRIDLQKGVIATVAGGGANARDGIAADCRLAQPVGLALDAAGDLLIADQGAHAVRRLALGHVD